jgi:hypothetical protein
MATIHPCVVCGKPKPGKRRRRTCGDSTCVQTAVRRGQLAGGAFVTAKAKASRAVPYIESGVCFVPLTQGAFAKIDVRDAAMVTKKCWYLYRDPRTGRKYAVREEGGATVRLHRWLLNTNATEDVDHKNGDGLDNRRENLRTATAAQNTYNARKRTLGTSKYKGVNKDDGGRCGMIWRSRIRVDRKLIHLGRFGTEEEAARAYDEAARQRFGKFACVNFPVGDEQSAHD